MSSQELARVTIVLRVDSQSGESIATRVRAERSVRWLAVPRVGEQVELLDTWHSAAVVRTVSWRADGSVVVMFEAQPEPVVRALPGQPDYGWTVCPLRL